LWVAHPAPDRNDTRPAARPAAGRVRMVGVVTMSAEAFEQAVADALDEVPPELTRLMSNVGIYEGTPLTERGSWWAAGALPDRITIFRGPTLRACDTVDDVVEEVAVTVVHEIAHHFGIDDERLHELGWG
jgi:predicted Zn-dependent protease with MMP-like domain